MKNFVKIAGNWIVIYNTLSKYTVLIFFIFLTGSSVSYANCMAFQGVTLCDNGDRQLTLNNVIYETKAGQMTIAAKSEYSQPYYSYDPHYFSHCYYTVPGCYGFGRYQGDLTGQ